MDAVSAAAAACGDTDGPAGSDSTVAELQTSSTKNSFTETPMTKSTKPIKNPTAAKLMFLPRARPQQQQQVDSLPSPPPTTDDDSDFTPRIYTLGHLPSRNMVSKILDAFYSCSGTLFFVVPRDTAFELLGLLYKAHTTESTTRLCAALGELCAIVAVGAQYDYDAVLQEQRRAFFDTARAYVGQVVKVSELRAMRVHALLAMFSIMEKRIAAWSYIAAALKIAQTYGLHKNYSEVGGFSKEEWKLWRKNWRTLKFFESWLAGTLGRLPDVEYNANFEDFRALTIGESLSSQDKTIPGVDIGVDIDVIQTELGKIGFLMASILKNVYRRDRCSIKSIEAQMRHLEQWHLKLPYYMRLETLASDIPDIRARRAIMLVHMMYLASIILLTRKLVIQLVSREEGTPWLYDGTKEEAHHYMEICFGAARHTAMLLGILLDEGAVFKRCWLLINHSFNALILLLFHVIQKQRHGRPAAEYLDYLRSAVNLLRLLIYCSSADSVAFDYLRTVEPYSCLFEQLIPEDPEMRETLAQMQDVLKLNNSSSPEPRQKIIVKPLPDTPSQSPYPQQQSTPKSDSDDSQDSDSKDTDVSISSTTLDFLAQDLFEIIRSPFGGLANVESGGQLSQMPAQEDTCHGRFWSGGWKSQFSLKETERTCSLKRVFEDDDESDGSGWRGMSMGMQSAGAGGIARAKLAAKRWKGMGICEWDLDG